MRVPACTTADFDSYTNQRRGIEMTPKEQQAILNFTKAKPTKRDKFFVEYETTDAFGNNTTTIIKKLRDGGQYVWTAFAKHESSEDKEIPTSGEEKEAPSKPDLSKLKEAAPIPSMPTKPSQPTKPVSTKPAPVKPAPIEKPEDEEVVVDDPIRITKTVPFVDDIEGSDTLADLLNKLDV